MGIFKKMKKARPNANAPYIVPGNYVFQIQSCKLHESSNPETNGNVYFIAELLTIESDNEELKVGSRPAHRVNMSKNTELALGNVKDFLMAGYGAIADLDGDERPDLDDIDEDASELAVSEDNPLVGAFVSCNAWNKQTKKNTPFTRTDWGVPENLVALAEAV